MRESSVRIGVWAAIVAVVLVAACERSPQGSGSDPVAPTFDFVNGPDQPGPVVVRQEDGSLLILGIDSKTGLLSIIGLPEDPADWDACGGTEGLQGGLHAQFVELPGGAIVAQHHGEDRNVIVYDLGSFLSRPTLCASLLEATVVARGTADVTRTDNDVTGVGRTAANSWGWRANGVLQDEVTGADLSYLEVQRLQVLPDGSFQVRAANDAPSSVPSPASGGCAWSAPPRSRRCGLRAPPGGRAA